MAKARLLPLPSHGVQRALPRADSLDVLDQQVDGAHVVCLRAAYQLQNGQGKEGERTVESPEQ